MPRKPAKVPAPSAIMPAEIVQILEGYRTEAKRARESGDNPRDQRWRDNVDLYWNRFDFSNKADWQAREVMPEVPQFIDRFAASMKEALTSSKNFYTIVDPADKEGDLGRAIRRLMDVWLSECGRTPQGHPVAFPAVFEDLMKLAGMMNPAAMVTWKLDQRDGHGYVAVDTIDPRNVWIDHTGRGLYRVRRLEVDKTQLMELARQTDGRGQPLYDLDQIELLATSINSQMQEDRRRLSGQDPTITSNRQPLFLDEYLATLITPDGRMVAKDALCVVADEKFLIRGPEANPFWHKQDWVVTTAVIPVPLSPYGRTYMEDFGPLARTFTELTNLIIDATFTSSIKAFAVDPTMLEDPLQLEQGIYPNVMFRLDGGVGRPQDFIKEIDLGKLPAEAVQVWQTIKNELREAAKFNEIALGGFAPKGRTSASEIVATEQNSNEVISSMAKTIEERVVEVLLNLVWKTGVQHMDPNDPKLAQAAGPEMYAALVQQRKELLSRPITFQVRGISEHIARAQKLRDILQILGVVGQNPILLQRLMQKIDPGKLIDELFALRGIDLDKLSLSPREQAIAAITGAGQGPAGATGGSPPLPGGPAAAGASAPGAVRQTTG